MGAVAVSERCLSELLNAYLAIEALLGSKYISDDTRTKAYETLKLLNQQLAELLGQMQGQDIAA